MRIVRYYPRAATGDGGMTAAIACWSQLAASAGADVTIAFDRGEAPPVTGHVRWVPVRHLGPRRVRLPVGLEDTLRGADLLVLHSGWAPHNTTAAAIARRLGVPYLLEPRGAYDPHIVQRKSWLKGLWWRAQEQELVAKAHAVHIFFDAERPHLQALGYHGPFVVAPNGVSSFDGVRWDGGSGGYVLWLGRFDLEHKGVDMLIDAVALLDPAERPQVRLCGPDSRVGGKQEVGGLIRERQLDAWIHVEPAVHGPAKYERLARAAGFIYPSRWEGFGNSAAEAVVTGVPTVVTPYPLGRYLAARDAAILVDATPQGLADGLRALHSPRARAVARRGAEIARADLAWDRVTQSWLQQVQTLL